MKVFNDLTISDVLLGLEDLLRETPDAGRPLRLTALALVDGDRIWRGLLGALRTALAALPPELRGLPLSALLDAADARFDRAAQALRLVQQLVALLPRPTEGALAAAASVEVLVPPGIGRTSYAAEALHATQLAPTLATHRAGLEAVALPDLDTPTAWAMAERFVAAGLELDRLASNRGQTLATRGDRSAAGALRGKAMGELNALRVHVARALEARSDLPRDLDGQIFGYFDELERLATGRAAGGDAALPPSPTPAPAPT